MPSEQFDPGGPIIPLGTTIFVANAGTNAAKGDSAQGPSGRRVLFRYPLTNLDDAVNLDCARRRRTETTVACASPRLPQGHTQIFSHHWEEDQDLTINRVCDSGALRRGVGARSSSRGRPDLVSRRLHHPRLARQPLGPPARGTGGAVHARPLPLRPRAGPPIGRTAQGPRLRQAGLVPPARARPLGTERFLSRPLILGWA